MEEYGKIREDEVYSSSLKTGVVCRGAAYSGLVVTKFIIIKRSIIRIESCSLFLVVRDIVTKTLINRLFSY